MINRFYITTAIPYVNAKPHIGFALELIQADVLARYHKLAGDDVYFLTGTDDNALKNVQAAEKAGKKTEDFVDENAAVFEELTKELNISNDQFIRTTSKEHFVGAQKLWSLCKKEDIYKKKYKGLYCVGCEQFYMEKELVDGKCPEHQTVPEEIEEENYFFKLSAYQTHLEKLIESDEYCIVPASRKNEMLSFIRMGLEDFSISRSVARAKGWGVPVPGDEAQIMYVWFDALSNYITALGFGSADDSKFKKYWPADLHVIGKGITRFHAIYWPAMLLSAGLTLPKALFVHGYINVEGAKMSKTIGNVIDPFALIEKYGVEAVRFYLLKHIHPFEDSDFSYKAFEEAYNADLANGLGNLLSRVTNMVEKYLDGKIDENFRQLDQGFQQKVRLFLVGSDDNTKGTKIAGFNFQSVMMEIWSEIQDCDQIIDERKPWRLAKDGQAALHEVLKSLMLRLYNIAYALKPFMPDTAAKIETILTANRIVKAEPLFGRIYPVRD